MLPVIASLRAQTGSNYVAGGTHRGSLPLCRVAGMHFSETETESEELSRSVLHCMGRF
jgi:hypothetical protein